MCYGALHRLICFSDFYFYPRIHHMSRWRDQVAEAHEKPNDLSQHHLILIPGKGPGKGFRKASGIGTGIGLLCLAEPSGQTAGRWRTGTWGGPAAQAWTSPASAQMCQNVGETILDLAAKHDSRISWAVWLRKKKSILKRKTRLAELVCQWKRWMLDIENWCWCLL